MQIAATVAVSKLMHCHVRKVEKAAAIMNDGDPLSAACLIQAQRITRRTPCTDNEKINLALRLKAFIVKTKTLDKSEELMEKQVRTALVAKVRRMESNIFGRDMDYRTDMRMHHLGTKQLSMAGIENLAKYADHLGTYAVED